MLTLKVVHEEGADWHPGVTVLRTVGSFPIDVGPNGASRGEVIDQAAKGLTDRWPETDTVNVAPFPAEAMSVGVVAVADHIDGRHCAYVMPIGSGYLIGPDGGTIDRINA